MAIEFPIDRPKDNSLREQPTGDRVFYHADHLESPRAVTDRYGNLVELIRYDVLGKVRGVYERDVFGSIVEKTGGVSTNLTFTGQEPDEETSLIYFGKRFYDPEIGYFLTIDPVLQFASPYNYGGYDPLNSIDPNGAELFSFGTALIVASLFAGAAIIDTLAKGGDLGTALKAGAFAFGASLFASMSAHVLSVAFEGVSAVQTLQFAYAGFGLYQTFKAGNIATGVLSLGLAVFGPPGGEETRGTGEQADSGVAKSGQAPGSGPIESLEPSAATAQRTIPQSPSRVGNFAKAIGRSLIDDVGATFRGLAGLTHGLVGSSLQTLYGLVTGNPGLASRGLLNLGKALVPRYGNFAGPNWPNDGRQLKPFANQVDQAAYVHDQAYANLDGTSAVSADRTLIRNVWTGAGIQPGPFGQIYRILLTTGFGAKIGVQAILGF